jgi:hypothetical protein
MEEGLLGLATSSPGSAIVAGLPCAESVSLPTLLARAGMPAATVMLFCGAESVSASCCKLSAQMADFAIDVAAFFDFGLFLFLRGRG